MRSLLLALATCISRSLTFVSFLSLVSIRDAMQFNITADVIHMNIYRIDCISQVILSDATRHSLYIIQRSKCLNYSSIFSSSSVGIAMGAALLHMRARINSRPRCWLSLYSFTGGVKQGRGVMTCCCCCCCCWSIKIDISRLH